ncbi:hypothetical protein JG687_00011819 [Phytophthora cactorum]|uniref:Uncharacterized protein n=1 Tax=Phytophthora cactorum TaxID=29920 RepID=A0A8T1U3J5_9STRA|nr:hypothetical protein JG687_00011819 [Phytophthora cactorum]
MRIRSHYEARINRSWVSFRFSAARTIAIPDAMITKVCHCVQAARKPNGLSLAFGSASPCSHLRAACSSFPSAAPARASSPSLAASRGFGRHET